MDKFLVLSKTQYDAFQLSRCVTDLVFVGCYKEGPKFDAKYIVNQWKSMKMTHEECLLKCKNGVGKGMATLEL